MYQTFPSAAGGALPHFPPAVSTAVLPASVAGFVPVQEAPEGGCCPWKTSSRCSSEGIITLPTYAVLSYSLTHFLGRTPASGRNLPECKAASPVATQLGCLPTRCSQRGHGSLQASVATRPGSELPASLPARGRQRKHPGRLLGETRGRLTFRKP